VEQRWVNGDYRNRFRYRLNMFVPLNNKKIVAKTWFISVFDEIFFNNKAPNFERNRVSAALGYQFDKKWILQAGWLNQRNYTATTSSAKNNMLLTLMYRINRKNSVETSACQLQTINLVGRYQRPFFRIYLVMVYRAYVC
jgi:hypothetical protein